VRHREAPIVAGLNKPAGRPEGARQAAPDAGPAVVAVPRAVDRAIGWAARRRLTPVSMSGISAACAVCAAAWLCGETAADRAAAVAALACCWLGAAAARAMARQGQPASGLAWAADASRIGRVAVLAGEAAVLAGLATGGSHGALPGLWPSAIAVLILISVRETLGACSPARREAGGPVATAAWQVLDMPPGGRLLLIAVVTVGWGARTALYALFGWSILAIGVAVITGLARPGPAARQPRRPPDRPAPGGLDVLLGPAGPPPPRDPAGWPPEAAGPRERATPRPGAATPAGTALARLPGYPPAGAQSGRGGPPRPGWRQPARRAVPAGPPPPATVISAARDDGAVARWLGRLVRGNLMPLPPAVAGLAAAAVLAVLGLRGLPGFIMLTPLVVLVLLAGPGSSHPHDGRADWLVPALLQAAQYIYIAAVGFATGVPAPVTFILCAACAALHADLAAAAGAGQDVQQPIGARMGWEGRMLIVGVAGAAGLATFAYLALAAYLGMLICWKLSISRRAAPAALREGVSR